jgi:hypothetical protein
MPSQPYPIQVNYDLSLDEMIRAGTYDVINFAPPQEQSPIQMPGGVVHGEIEFLTFDRDYELPAMLDETDRRGYRPASLPEFLALGAQHPDLQRKSWILTLGSVETRRFIRFSPTQAMQVEQFIPCLLSWMGERVLYAGSFDGKYRPDCSFACVRNNPTPA